VPLGLAVDAGRSRARALCRWATLAGIAGIAVPLAVGIAAGSGAPGAGDAGMGASGPLRIAVVALFAGVLRLAWALRAARPCEAGRWTAVVASFALLGVLEAAGSVGPAHLLFPALAAGATLGAFRADHLAVRPAFAELAPGLEEAA